MSDVLLVCVLLFCWHRLGMYVLFGLIVCVLLALSSRIVCYDVCLCVFVNVGFNVVFVSCSVLLCIHICVTVFGWDVCLVSLCVVCFFRRPCFQCVVCCLLMLL